MRPVPRSVSLLVALLLAATACTGVSDRIEDLRGGGVQPADALRSTGEEVRERAQYCLSLARALAAIESDSPATASDAVEEAFAQAPPDLRDDARAVVDAVRAAQVAGDRELLRDPDVHAAADRLRDRSRELCDPTA